MSEKESPGQRDDIHFQSSKSLFFKLGTQAKYLDDLNLILHSSALNLGGI